MKVIDAQADSPLTCRGVTSFIIDPADIGPVAVRPPWCNPGAAPEWTILGDDSLIVSWERIMSEAVWVSREDAVEDGRVVPGVTRIHVEIREGIEGIDPASARRLAAELLAAADLAEQED